MLVLGACASTQVFAQDAACPIVTVASAAEVSSPDAAPFKASVTGGGADINALYNWQVSAGTIVAGQGTADILVATDGMPAGQVIEAMIEVLGYPASCDTSASASTAVVKSVPRAYLVYEGPYSDDAELVRLIDAVIANRPAGGKGYVIFDMASSVPAGELDRLKKAATTHIESKGENPEDYPLMEGTPRDQTMIEVWFGNPGDEAPSPGAAN